MSEYSNPEDFDPEGVFQKVVIFDKRGRVLLLQAGKKYGQKAGTWDLPGGKVHKGETFEEAILREVEEETGILLEEIYPADVDIVKFSDGKTRIGIIYFAILEKDVKLSHEHVAYEWVSPSSIEKNIFSFIMAPEWIEKALEMKTMMRL